MRLLKAIRLNTAGARRAVLFSSPWFAYSATRDIGMRGASHFRHKSFRVVSKIPTLHKRHSGLAQPRLRKAPELALNCRAQKP